MRLFLTLVLAFAQLSCIAQEKVFRKVMAQGRPPMQFYRFENNKNKMYRLSEFTGFCKSNGWIIGNTSEKSMVRFGDVDNTIATFEFLPKGEYTGYILENMTNGVRINDMASKGNMFFYTGNGDNMLAEKSNVSWSGQVVNGKINGSGVGFFTEGSTYYAFRGNFQDGLPTGEFVYNSYNPSEAKNTYFVNKYLRNNSNSFGNVSDGMLWVKVGNQYGFVDSSGKTVIKPIYKDVKPFSGGIAVVTKGDVRVKINKTGKILGFDEGQNFSIDELAKLAKNQPDLEGEIGKMLNSRLSNEKSYETIVDIQKKFPDSYSFYFARYKADFFRKDAQRIDECYQLLKQSIEKGGKSFDAKDYSKDVFYFLSRYEEDYFGEKAVTQALAITVWYELKKCTSEPYYSSWRTLQLNINSMKDEMAVLLLSSEIIDKSVAENIGHNYDKVLNRIDVLKKQEETKNKNKATASSSSKKKRSLDDLTPDNIRDYVENISESTSTREYESGGHYETYGSSYDGYEDLSVLEALAMDDVIEDYEVEEWVPQYSKYNVTIYTAKMKDFYGKSGFTITVTYDPKYTDSTHRYMCGDHVYPSLELALLLNYWRHYGYVK